MIRCTVRTSWTERTDKGFESAGIMKARGFAEDVFIRNENPLRE